MNLLRRNDSAQGVTTRQHDATMVYFCGRPGGIGFRQTLPFDQRATAGRAPVRLCLCGKDSVALAADSFHISKLIESPLVNGQSTSANLRSPALIPDPYSLIPSPVH